MFNRRWDMRLPGALLLVLIMCMFPLSCSGKETKTTAVKKAETPAAEAARAADSYDSTHRILKLGAPAPDVSLKDAAGGTVTISGLAGKTVVIAFWHPTCGPCVEMIKEMETAFAARKASVTILAVTADEGDKKNADKAKKLAGMGSKAKAVFDVNNAMSRAYEMATVPYFALVDSKGALRYAGSLIVSQPIRTITFTDMAVRVANGAAVPKCELSGMISPPEYDSLIGTQAPAFRLKGVDGVDQSPAFYKGFSRLLLTFWSPGCPHCKMQLPRVESFIRSDGRRLGVQAMSAVGLPNKNDPENPQYVAAINQVVSQLQITHPVALDYGGEANNLYKVRGVPSMFLIGKDGTIEKAWRGQFMFVAETMECAISEFESKGAGAK